MLAVYFLFLTFLVDIASAFSRQPPPLAELSAAYGKDVYIVQLKKELSSRELKDHHDMAQELQARSLLPRLDGPAQKSIYKFEVGDFKGYVAGISPKDAEILRSSPDVVAVVKNQRFKVTKDHSDVKKIPPKSKSKAKRADGPPVDNQNNAPSHLVRLTKRAGDSLGNTYMWVADGDLDDSYAYVLDTGINEKHSEFEGRATNAISVALLDNGQPAPPNMDGFGHGTTIASLIGGKIHGVLKSVKLVGVKILASEVSFPHLLAFRLLCAYY